MTKEDMQRTGRNLWGFFSVAVWMVGVPMVCKLGYKGATGAISEARAVVYGSEVPHTERKPDVPPDLRVDVLKEMTDAEFEEMVGMYYEQKANQKKKGR